MNNPLPPKKRTVFLWRSRRRVSRVVSRPLDTAHIADTHRKAIIDGYNAVAENNSAKPVLKEVVRLLLGDEAVE